MARKILFDTTGTFERKVNALGILIYAVTALLFLRIMWLQVFRGPVYLEKSRENQEQHIVVPAERGEILDRNYDPLTRTNWYFARNDNSMDIYLIPGSLTPREIAATASNLSSLVGRPLTNLLAKLSNVLQGRHYLRYEPVLLLRNIDKNTLIRIAENSFILPGIHWQNNPYRVYPGRELAAHALGYVGRISREEIDQNAGDGDYHPMSMVGKAGIEKYYDKELRGKDGEFVRIVDAQNRIKDTIQVRDPAPGRRLVLCLDRKVQETAETIMRGEVGAMIITDPATGEVLALCSSPTFDPNMFIGEIDPDRYRKLSENELFPFLNRAVSAMYPPSSTFKIVTQTAALEEEVVTASDKFYCMGHFNFENDDRIFRCWGIHGWVDAVKAIAVSCDIYYYNIGYQLGSEKITRYARQFGIGSLSGIDLPSESAGFIPSHAWKRKVFKEAWYDGDTINTAIGQGFLLTTPIQMLDAVSAIANGGVIYKPYIVSRILNSANDQPIKVFKPQILRNISMSQKNLAILREGLARVMSSGTGYLIGRSMRIRVYGKTGTAQLYKGNPHAWFVGYTPEGRYDRQYAIVVFVEHGGGGGEKAVPLGVAALQSILLKEDPKESKARFLGILSDYQQERTLQRQEQQEQQRKFNDVQFQ